MHTSKSGLETWKQRLCTGNMGKGVGSRWGTAAGFQLCWAALAGMWLLALGMGTLALPALQDQGQALHGKAATRLAGACSLLRLQSGDSR